MVIKHKGSIFQVLCRLCAYENYVGIHLLDLTQSIVTIRVYESIQWSMPGVGNLRLASRMQLFRS